MNSALRLVGERLPRVREQVLRLFERDEVFRELCDEYQVCSETAARMESAAGASLALRDEYVALRLRLEGELLRYLVEHADA
jgi:hypothetical protein